MSSADLSISPDNRKPQTKMRQRIELIVVFNVIEFEDIIWTQISELADYNIKTLVEAACRNVREVQLRETPSIDDLTVLYVPELEPIPIGAHNLDEHVFQSQKRIRLLSKPKRDSCLLGLDDSIITAIGGRSNLLTLTSEKKVELSITRLEEYLLLLNDFQSKAFSLFSNLAPLGKPEDPLLTSPDRIGKASLMGNMNDIMLEALESSRMSKIANLIRGLEVEIQRRYNYTFHSPEVCRETTKLDNVHICSQQLVKLVESLQKHAVEDHIAANEGLLQVGGSTATVPHSPHQQQAKFTSVIEKSLREYGSHLPTPVKHTGVKRGATVKGGKVVALSPHEGDSDGSHTSNATAEQGFDSTPETVAATKDGVHLPMQAKKSLQPSNPEANFIDSAKHKFAEPKTPSSKTKKKKKKKKKKEEEKSAGKGDLSQKNTDNQNQSPALSKEVSKAKVACEQCRQTKKAKCSKDLPTCKACRESKSECRYLGGRNFSKCVECIGAKQACSKEHPSCSQCVAKGKTCSYPPSDQPRCDACTKQHVACTKELPSCFMCRSRNIKCVYPPIPPPVQKFPKRCQGCEEEKRICTKELTGCKHCRKKNQPCIYPSKSVSPKKKQKQKGETEGSEETSKKKKKTEKGLANEDTKQNDKKRKKDQAESEQNTPLSSKKQKKGKKHNEGKDSENQTVSKKLDSTSEVSTATSSIDEKAASGKPAKKDKNAPKGPINSYMFFCNEKRKDKPPEMSFPDFSRECSKEWKDMDTTSKSKFQQLAEKDRVRYKEQMSRYVPPEPKAMNGLHDNEMHKKDSKQSIPTEDSSQKSEADEKPVRNDKSSLEGPKNDAPSKTKKDKNLPKKPKNAYDFYRAEFFKAKPNEPFAEIAKLCAKKWKKLEKDERTEYEELAKQDKKRYNEEVSKHQFALVQESSQEKNGGGLKETSLKPAKKDKNAPKKGRTAYQLFMSELKKEHPGQSFSDISKLCGKRWKEMSDESRLKYDNLSKMDKQRYEEENTSVHKTKEVARQCARCTKIFKTLKEFQLHTGHCKKTPKLNMQDSVNKGGKKITPQSTDWCIFRSAKPNPLNEKDKNLNDVLCEWSSQTLAPGSPITLDEWTTVNNISVPFQDMYLSSASQNMFLIKPFTAVSTPDGQTLFNACGSVWALHSFRQVWSSSNDVWIAVGTGRLQSKATAEQHVSLKQFHLLQEPISYPNLLQFWKMSKDGEVSLQFAVGHTSGAVWQLQWHPSLTEASAQSRPEKQVDAVAGVFSDGTVRVFSVMRLADEASKKLQSPNACPGPLVWDQQPCTTLSLPGALLTCLSWGPQAQSVLLTGTSEGMVLTWRVSPSKSKEDAWEATILQHFNAGSGVSGNAGMTTIRSVVWCPVADNMFAAIGNSGILTIWDTLGSSFEPVLARCIASNAKCSLSTLKKIGVNLQWVLSGRLILMTCDDGMVSGLDLDSLSASISQFRTLSAEVATWALASVNLGSRHNHEELVVTATGHGQCNMFKISNLFSKRNQMGIQAFQTYTLAEKHNLDSENKGKVSQTNEKPRGINIYMHFPKQLDLPAFESLRTGQQALSIVEGSKLHEQKECKYYHIIIGSFQGLVQVFGVQI